MKKAVYAGSFDPFTKGHEDIVRQALKVFDHIVIARGVNPAKIPLFNDSEASQLINGYFFDDSEHIEVTSFTGSLVQFAHEQGAVAIVRGLRQVSDFNEEFRLHGVNSRAAPNMPMTYFICHSDFLHVSSSTAREMASLGMNTDWLVNPMVQLAMSEKYA